MAKGLKALTDFLIGLGIEQIGHTNKTYLAHLIGVYRDLCRSTAFRIPEIEKRR